MDGEHETGEEGTLFIFYDYTSMISRTYHPLTTFLRTNVNAVLLTYISINIFFIIWYNLKKKSNHTSRIILWDQVTSNIMPDSLGSILIYKESKAASESTFIKSNTCRVSNNRLFFFTLLFIMFMGLNEGLM